MHRVIFVVLVAALAGCSDQSKHYRTTVQLARTHVVQSPQGKVIDVELEYSDCPGEQQEIFQADAAFADCIARYKPGDKVEAQVVWSRLPDGHYDSEVERVGECPRKRDARDVRSYEVIHECSDIVVNGVVVGFHCDRKPTPKLLAACPWFRRT